MIIRLRGLSRLAESKGCKIESVWMHGMIGFDLIRLSDGAVILEDVGAMDVEIWLLEH